jgi:hypothetical protein
MADTPDLDGYLAHFRARVLQDALNEATGTYWTRRAHALEDARSRPGDHPGTRDPAWHAARNQRLTDAAQACRHRASLALLAPHIAADVWRALGEVA